MQRYSLPNPPQQYHQYTPLVMMYYLFAPMEDLLTGSMGTVAKYIAMVIILLGLISTNGEIHLNFNKVNKCLLYLLALSTASCLWAVNREIAVGRNVAYLLVPGLAFFVGQLDFSPRERESIISAAIAGGVLTVGYLVVNGQIDLTSMQRLNLTKGNDQNGFAALMLLPFGLSIGRIPGKSLPIKCMYMGFALVFLFVVLMTGSRGGLLGICAFVFICVFFAQKGKRTRTIISMVALLIFAYFFVLPYLPEHIRNRLFKNDSYMNTMNAHENRGAFWKLGITKIFTSNPLLGVGAGCVPIMLGRYFSTNRAMHNTYINMLCEFGLLGLPAFLWMLWNLFYRKFKQQKLIEMALLVGICLIIFFLDAYAKKFFWNVIMLLMIEPKSPSKYKEVPI